MDHFKDWLKQPFSADMSAAGWLAFMTLLLGIAVLQGFVLKHIREAA